MPRLSASSGRDHAGSAQLARGFHEPRGALLTREGERRLFELMALAAAERVRATDERARIRARHRWTTARDELVEANLGLVFAEARRRGRGRLPLDEIVQEGTIGLLRAIEKFDPGRGYKLSTYATWWIRTSIDRAVEKLGRTVRVPAHVHELHRQAEQARHRLRASLGREPQPAELARAAGCTEHAVDRARRSLSPVRRLDDPIGADGDESWLTRLSAEDESRPDCVVERQQQLERVRAVMEALPPDEHAIIVRRFGIAGHHAHTIEQLCHALALDRPRVRTLMSRAMRRLRGSSVTA